MYISLILCEYISADGFSQKYLLYTRNNNYYKRIPTEFLYKIDKNFSDGDNINLGIFRIYGEDYETETRKSKIVYPYFIKNSDQIDLDINWMGSPKAGLKKDDIGFYNVVLPAHYAIMNFTIQSPNKFEKSIYWDSIQMKNVIFIQQKSGKDIFSFQLKIKLQKSEKNILDNTMLINDEIEYPEHLIQIEKFNKKFNY